MKLSYKFVSAIYPKFNCVILFVVSKNVLEITVVVCRLHNSPENTAPLNQCPIMHGSVLAVAIPPGKKSALLAQGWGIFQAALS